jgi:3',5'-cyclic AMP phosphodiesterase CpdA
MRRIAHISDLHFGHHDPRKVAALLKSLAETHPDLVAVSGDLTQRARNSEFAEARHFLDRIPGPVLVVPGNHDVPLFDVRRRFFKPFTKFNRHIAPTGIEDCIYTDEEMVVLGLNTARRFTWKNGRVSWDQMAHIRHIFSHLPADMWKIVMTHHPIASAHGEARVELAGRSILALRALADVDVHLLLSGHHHRPASGEAHAELLLNGSVLVVHAGTAVSTRTRGPDGNSYNLIRLEPGSVAVKIMAWSGDAFQEIQETRYAVPV